MRRVVRRIKKHATWLGQPHFGSLLYAYGALFVRFVDLHSVEAEPVDDLGRPFPITNQLMRVAGRLAQLAAQLGLSLSAERALRHDDAAEARYSIWLGLANAKDEDIAAAERAAAQVEEVVTPQAALAATNGTSIPAAPA